MPDLLTRTMDKPCEICGHVGWVDPLTVCSKCKVTTEHIYCMRVAYDGDREKWVCEECDSPSQKPSSKPASGKQSSGTGMRFIMKKPPQTSKVQYLTPEEAIVLESGAIGSYLSSPTNSYFVDRSSVKKPTPSILPQKFRIKQNPPVGPCSKDNNFSASTEVENSAFQKDYAWQESSVSRRSSAINMQTSNTMMRKEIDGPARQHCGESPRVKRVTFGELPKRGAERDNINLDLTSVQLGRPAQQNCRNTPSAKYIPNGKLSKDINSVRTSQLVHHFPTVTSGIDICSEAQPKKIDSKERESPRVTMLFDSYLPNHPAVSPAWKGTFQITDDIKHCTIFDEIQAYPPCKVHRKVYKVSKQFPKTLFFELLPRRDSWVDFFEDDVPGGLDIGFYFLSSSYCSLLEYLDEQDMLLRACLDEVELFVFSSKHLREDSRKIHQKHFLWGLLRPCEANNVASMAIFLPQNFEVKDKVAEPSRVEFLGRVDAINSSESQQVQQPMSEELEAEDMDVDMIGGHELGNIDRVEHEAEDMNVDMLGGHELGNIDTVVPKLTDNACGDHIEGKIETSTQVKASPKSLGGVVPEVSLLKIKREWPDGYMEAPLLSSCVKDDELEFEKKLQRSFDSFAALLQVKEAGCVIRDVKVEPDA